jgi:predicted metal-dependent HD superfamily phosphohydrolase
MSKPSIIDQAEEHVTQLLTQGLSEDHTYHSLSHTLAVHSACQKLGQHMEISPEEMEILELAALFHDVGFVEVYNGHEGVSRRYAREFLEQQNYPEEKLEKVLACIEVTFPPNRPQNVLEKIIRDADLINLGSAGYATHLTGLRHEWEVFLGQKYTDRDWYKLNRNFLKSQSFFTDAAREMYEPKLKNNISWLKKMAKGAKKARQAAEFSPIKDNKSAQMMFKTALRNHIDLSTLADNKANIMLSVNALIITLIVPIAAGQIENTPYLLIPVLILLLTCLLSMIYATLATRPIKMLGTTEVNTINEGKSNLFFFGNFYRMKFGTYKKGIYKVLEKNEDLEDSIMRDLFFLGKSLGTKYAQLRICYTIFMIGVSSAVLAFMIAYAINN